MRYTNGCNIVMVLFMFLFSQVVFSQKRLKGYGIYGGVTTSAHEYINLDAHKMELALLERYFYTRNHQSKEFVSWAAGIFGEWALTGPLFLQSELEYINKGAQEKPYVNIYTLERTENFLSNTYTYFTWNTALKYYFKPQTWYAMSGVRLEYLFKSSTPVFSEFSSQFPKIWYGGDIALGYEFPIKKRAHGFIEFHYNPDLLWHYHKQIRIKNRTLELRTGIVIRERKRRIDDCNAPKYNGPKYPM